MAIMRSGYGRLLIGMMLLISGVMSAHATLRCDTHLIEEGALTVDVLRKCGEPNSRDIRTPALDANGQPRPGAVTVETWVYGPENGMYRYLRFIDGELVKIWSKPK